MKTNLPHAPRLTDKEEAVIQWAFNMAHSIVAGNYNMPKPMCYAINNLQDAVHDLANERDISIKDGCSKEYLGFYSGYLKAMNETIRRMTK